MTYKGSFSEKNRLKIRVRVFFLALLFPVLSIGWGVGCAAGAGHANSSANDDLNETVREELNVWNEMSDQKREKLLSLARLGRGKVRDNRARTLLGYAFDGGEKAYDRGIQVIQAIRRNQQTHLNSLSGKLVAFYGVVAPPGKSADLRVAKEVLLHVEIEPSEEVRPQANAWTAGVLGILESVDTSRGIVYIRARPDLWAPFQTW